MTKIEELLKAKDELIAKANEIGKQIEELKEKPSQERFVPEYGERYWYLNAAGVVQYYTNIKDRTDRWLILTGNCYRTIEEAEAVREAIIELDKLTFIPDWGDNEQLKFSNYYDNIEMVWSVTDQLFITQSVGRYYYPTRQKAIEGQKWEEVLRKAGK